MFEFCVWAWGTFLGECGADQMLLWVRVQGTGEGVGRQQVWIPSNKTAPLIAVILFLCLFWNWVWTWRERIEWFIASLISQPEHHKDIITVDILRDYQRTLLAAKTELLLGMESVILTLQELGVQWSTLLALLDARSVGRAQ